MKSDSFPNATAREIATDALSRLPYDPLPQQLRLLAALSTFAVSAGGRDIMVINGYAGTGKTSVVGAVIAALTAHKRKVVLLAPTGRAAKVASAHASFPASTIHKRLFRGDILSGKDKEFFLAQNRDIDTLFIADEASLISDTGNNSLLHLLVNHVYSAPGCHLVLVGDLAQLPPVGQDTATAMNPDRLRALGLNPIMAHLDVPVRQKAESGILHNANIIRSFLYSDKPATAFSLDTEGYPDIINISSQDLDEYLSASYSKVGKEETMIITRSNKRANEFNRAVRNLVLYAEEPLMRTERIMIAKNDYFWSRINGLKTFLANGDIAEITWIGSLEKNYGRYFCDVELRIPDMEKPVGAKIMMRSLVSDGPAIPQAEMERFYNIVLLSQEGELSAKTNAAATDPYLNALQIKYAYCVTCHKAQGGQWKHIYIDMGMISRDAVGPDFYRWLYTAVTRATEKVFLINSSF